MVWLVCRERVGARLCVGRNRRSASIRALGHSIFIAESNVHHVASFADRLYVIERGEIIFTAAI
jgi:ABC-type branched-subunit amino acid transport system ATPase component